MSSALRARRSSGRLIERAATNGHGGGGEQGGEADEDHVPLALLGVGRLLLGVRAQRVGVGVELLADGAVDLVEHRHDVGDTGAGERPDVPGLAVVDLAGELTEADQALVGEASGR